LDWLPWAEYCYNTPYNSSLLETPFKVVYGCDPPALPGYSFGEAKLASVETALCERAEFLVEVRERLLQAPQHSKHYYDANHRELSFEIGDWVWLRLHHRQAASLPGHARGKLAQRFYSPYKILDRVGSVSYKLDLPAGTRLT